MIKLSDYIVRFFEDKNLQNIFILTGGGCMHLVNSFGNSKKIKYWCTHHEQSAAIAAEAYSKTKNNFGAVLVTSGPGATNTITGLLNCYQDSIPVIFISGQTKVEQTVLNSNIKNLRQFGSQEANIIPIVSSITKYAAEIQDYTEIKYHLERAIFEAKNGRPGPVWLSVPLDIQAALIDEKNLKEFNNNYQEIKVEPSIDEIEYILTELKNAKRPVIIAGHGISTSNSNDLLDKFCTNYMIPVVTTIMGIDNLEEKHICNIGRIGIKGTRAGNFAIQNADLIISLGSRLSVASIGHKYNLFAREAKVIVVDIDKYEHLKKTIKIDKIINCDVKKILQELQKYDLKIGFNRWLNKCNEWKQKYPVVLKEYNDDTNGINSYKFIDIINKYTKNNMHIVVDVGTPFYVVAQSIAMKKNQRYITAGGTGTMGFTIPASIGVAVSSPNDTVIGITGDGSFMQNMQELQVLKHHNFNVKIFIINNNGYYLINQTQKKYFNGNFVGESEVSGISFPNFEKIAYAFDIKYYMLETIKQCEEKLNSILLEKGPTIIEVIVDKNMEIMPLNASEIKEDGTMISKPLEDMYPFLDREIFKKEMIIDIVEE